MKVRICSALVLFLLMSLAEVAPAQTKMPEAENRDLQTALAEGGSSPSEILRSLERHLQKYPDSAQKSEIIRAIVKSAMEVNDKRRILLYGQQSLEQNADQPLVLERVTQILLESDDKDSAEKALKYAQKFEEILRALEKQGPSSRRNRGELLEELDRALSRALIMQARATGNLGRADHAIALATRAWSTYPLAAAAREVARWQAKAGHAMEAVRWYANAFEVPDPKNTDADRARDRAVMADLYRKEKGSETGLGDLMLRAYDETGVLMANRAELQRSRDPNSDLSDPMQFTLSALEGSPLRLESLKGKVLVLDFWATWCGPCRAQHPLYEEVRKRFKDRTDVVFLNINTDEDTSLVRPFLEENKWGRRIYFEDGLGTFLRVSSIPTTIIIDRDGKVSSRMNGFVPEKFVDQLTDRIKDALGDKRG